MRKFGNRMGKVPTVTPQGILWKGGKLTRGHNRQGAAEEHGGTGFLRGEGIEGEFAWPKTIGSVKGSQGRQEHSLK